jgi:hypothetical protein
LCSVYGLRESQINKDDYTYAVLLFTPPNYSRTPKITHKDAYHFCCKNYSSLTCKKDVKLLIIVRFYSRICKLLMDPQITHAHYKND